MGDALVDFVTVTGNASGTVTVPFAAGLPTGTFPLIPSNTSLQADGSSSALGAELEEVVSHHHPDLVVLCSDGRVTDGPGLA